MTPEQQKLVEDNHNLIFSHIHRYLNHNVEEYYGILAIALCNAAIHYDPSQDTKFSTYATVSFHNAVKMYYRKNANSSNAINHHTISLSTITTESDGYYGKDTTLEDIIPDESIDVEDICISKYNLSQLMKKITNPKHRSILYLHYAGYDQKEIARIVGHSQSYVSRLMIKMRNDYKDILKESK